MLSWVAGKAKNVIPMRLALEENMRRSTVPELTADQMIEVDRLMIEDYKIDLIQMMENAGHCLSLLARDRFFRGNFSGKRVVVLYG